MNQAVELKQNIVELAQSLGFGQVAVGAMAPLEQELKHYKEWLSRGYAAGMEYMKRNPQFRTSPQLLYPGSRSAIIVSVSYYTHKPAPPGPFYGNVARYAVGRDYHAVIRAKLRELKSLIESRHSIKVTGKAFTDDVALYEQGFANRHGVGFAGKNTLIIGPRLSGSYNFMAELFVDIELEPDGPYQGTCGQCFRCAAACPTGAIVEAGFVDANVCISYLTIENKEGIPLEVRPKIGDWVFGCDVCQEICPYNQKPPVTPWVEFQPEAGAGHYLHLPDLLSIKSEEEFRKRFEHTPLRRPKRRGLLRNALVVIGNQLRSATDHNREAVSPVVRLLEQFIRDEKDEMLKEHAEWALNQLP